MKFSISKQKNDNSNQRKERSALSAAIQTVVFIGGIIGIVTAFFFGFSFFKQDGTKANQPQYQSVSFYKLSGFEYKEPKPNEPNQTSSIPAEIQDLNGKKISLSGFMLPYKVDDQGNVSEFSLNGNYDMCYFGAPVSVNEWVMVKMDENLTVKYTHLPIKVSGTFEVGEEYKDGELLSLYRLRLEKLGDYKK